MNVLLHALPSWCSVCARGCREIGQCSLVLTTGVIILYASTAHQYGFPALLLILFAAFGQACCLDQVSLQFVARTLCPPWARIKKSRIPVAVASAASLRHPVPKWETHGGSIRLIRAQDSAVDADSGSIALGLAHYQEQGF